MCICIFSTDKSTVMMMMQICVHGQQLGRAVDQKNQRFVSVVDSGAASTITSDNRNPNPLRDDFNSTTVLLFNSMSQPLSLNSTLLTRLFVDSDPSHDCIHCADEIVEHQIEWDQKTQKCRVSCCIKTCPLLFLLLSKKAKDVFSRHALITIGQILSDNLCHYVHEHVHVTGEHSPTRACFSFARVSIYIIVCITCRFQSPRPSTPTYKTKWEKTVYLACTNMGLSRLMLLPRTMRNALH